MVSDAVWTGRAAVTLRTLLSSTAPVVWSLIRTMSPGRMSGVVVVQQ
jgi:hypothetical protein